MEGTQLLALPVEQPVPPMSLQRPEHQPRRRRLARPALRIQVQLAAPPARVICRRTSRSTNACTNSTTKYSHSRLATRRGLFSHTGATPNTLLSCSCRFSTNG